MATRYHIGAKGLRGPITSYAKRFDLLEVVVDVDGTGKAATQEPSLATLRRWRKSVTPQFAFSVVAGPAVARLKPGPAFDAELAAARAAADALEARAIVIKTPMDVTPTALQRSRLAKLFAPFPKDVTSVVWEPAGIWETGEAAVAAAEWGVVLGVDASREPVPVGPVAYVRLRAMGETRAYGVAALERVVDAIGTGRRDAFVVLETEGALKETKTLRQLVQRARSGQKGGLGRLVRPRGGIVVRDDEQE